MAALLFVTHPEVVIDPAVPVPDWPLSAVGRRRMERFATNPALHHVALVVSSGEQKARDGAQILAESLGVPARIDPELGENDRSSTGYIAPPEFWDVVDAFFARPDVSIRGWERAVDAQSRIVRAAARAAQSPVGGDVVVVSHGGVGALLLGHLGGGRFSRDFDQPHRGGGCYFAIARSDMTLLHDWRVIDDAAPVA
jgi:broad specificity phosphatase PhoE